MTVEVEFSPGCERIIAQNNIANAKDRARHIINYPNQYVCDDAVTRIVQFEWSDESIIMVDASILEMDTTESPTDESPDGIKTTVQLKRVRANLVLELQEQLPKGTLSQSEDADTNLAVVAENFGIPVSLHPDEPLSTVYAGPYLLNYVRTAGPIAVGMFFSASYNTVLGECELVWLLDEEKYMLWRKGQTDGI